jgi:ABC-type uncharacterized transport system involved in gliding motility auxiliary subunit
MLARLQNLVFILLFLVFMGLTVWLAEQKSHEFDLTWGNRNSLTETSASLLEKLDQPITITAFVRDDSKTIRDLISDLVERYRRHKADITLEFLNPDLVPQLVREHGITVDGQLLVQYGNRQETLQDVSEKSLTQLLVKLAGTDNSYIAYLQGHGERNLLGDANHDLGRFGQQLERKGYILQSLNLVKTQSIPANTRILVIASPRTEFLEGEIEIITSFIEAGGSLLWLTEPEYTDNLDELAASLDIKRLPGVIVDATSQLLGISDPTFALAVEYPQHSITGSLHSQTLFPKATGLVSADESDWEIQPILQTLARSWTELNPDAADTLRFDEGTEERPGPVTLGLALERNISGENQSADMTQRIIVVGDGDFLSNTYLGNGQNLDLGNAIVEWLNQNDNFIDIGVVSAPDTQLDISQAGAITLLLLFLVFIPFGLLATGITIWLKRRNR